MIHGKKSNKQSTRVTTKKAIVRKSRLALQHEVRKNAIEKAFQREEAEEEAAFNAERAEKDDLKKRKAELAAKLEIAAAINRGRVLANRIRNEIPIFAALTLCSADQHP